MKWKWLLVAVVLVVVLATAATASSKYARANLRFVMGNGTPINITYGGGGGGGGCPVVLNHSYFYDIGLSEDGKTCEYRFDYGDRQYVQMTFFGWATPEPFADMELVNNGWSRLLVAGESFSYNVSNNATSDIIYCNAYAVFCPNDYINATKRFRYNRITEKWSEYFVDAPRQSTMELYLTDVIGMFYSGVAGAWNSVTVKNDNRTFLISADPETGQCMFNYTAKQTGTNYVQFYTWVSQTPYSNMDIIKLNTIKEMAYGETISLTAQNKYNEVEFCNIYAITENGIENATKEFRRNSVLKTWGPYFIEDGWLTTQNLMVAGVMGLITVVIGVGVKDSKKKGEQDEE